MDDKALGLCLGAAYVLLKENGHADVADQDAAFVANKTARDSGPFRY